jgi:hypothetical protein
MALYWDNKGKKECHDCKIFIADIKKRHIYEVYSMAEKIIRVGINLGRQHRLVEDKSSFGIIYFDSDRLEDDIKRIKTMPIEGDCTKLFKNGLNEKNRSG